MADTEEWWPMVFYGPVTLNGELLPAGAYVLVYAGNDLIGQSRLYQAGSYGTLATGGINVGRYEGARLEFRYSLSDYAEIKTGSSTQEYFGLFRSGHSQYKNLQFSDDSIPDVEVLGIEYEYWQDLEDWLGLDAETLARASAAEAEVILSNNRAMSVDPGVATIYGRLSDPEALSESPAGIIIVNFIQTGTPSTRRLGSGERAGVLGSYISAFGRLPQTQNDWQDMVKIANGRWPAATSASASERAFFSFREIYLREPEFSHPHDNAAVTIMAYGLRPARRNLASEALAISFFRSIKTYQPVSAADWDMVRAIAYSGAVR